jgi:hypothetical protein
VRRFTLASIQFIQRLLKNCRFRKILLLVRRLAGLGDKFKKTTLTQVAKISALPLVIAIKRKRQPKRGRTSRHQQRPDSTAMAKLSESATDHLFASRSVAAGAIRGQRNTEGNFCQPCTPTGVVLCLQYRYPAATRYHPGQKLEHLYFFIGVSDHFIYWYLGFPFI